MIGYTFVGTRDLAKAKAFYDPLLSYMNLPLCFEDAQVASWGDTNDKTVPRFIVCTHFDGQPDTVGNGTMTA